MFKPILTPSDLLPTGTTREHYSLDLKSAIDLSKRFEMAKDMAAFANNIGGTLLIGAIEDPSSGTLQAYRPLSESDAAKTVKAYSETAIQRCYPTPFIDPKSIPLDIGHVVAINIWAFPSQPVGVKVRGDGADGFRGDSYVFPVRSGVDTNFIRPDQLPMFMLPEARRRAIMLESIPVDARRLINLSSGIDVLKVRLVEINHRESTFTIEWFMGSGTQIVVLPIDIIKYVWKNADGIWKIRISRIIINSDGSADIRE
ncbi:ATP-binding protein [Myxococcus sp. CA033]|uniref:AlbA family DNA-binding domain-containing protein n=1 Tax=Myxococcus sp. CA033 TaxID=2741516 RepID=UPI00157B9B4D|nr:ATP-binding protein [Myxococcus sp. CA033]NTX32818.1 ATP-binding protein [Myxococcus sp. CA033]